MSVINPRNRLVNFRLSEAEFEGLRSKCQAMGARSISEFARTAVLDKINRGEAGGPEANRNRVFQLDNKVAELETRVSQLLNLVAATGASVSPESVEAEVGAIVSAAAQRSF